MGDPFTDEELENGAPILGLAVARSAIEVAICALDEAGVRIAAVSTVVIVA